MTQANAPTAHILRLDALRGVAAFFIFLSHLVDKLLYAHPAYDSLFFYQYTQVGISIFFILSGFSLSLPFFRPQRHDAFIPSVFRRYLRLTLPMLAAFLLAYMMMQMELMHNGILVKYVDAGKYWWAKYQFTPSLSELVREAFYGVYSGERSRYDPPCWTMRYELYGSLLVFVYLYLFQRFRQRLIFYIAGIALIYGVLPGQPIYFICFLLGIALAQFYASHPFLHRGGTAPTVMSMVLLALTLIYIHSGWIPYSKDLDTLAAFGVMLVFLIPSPISCFMETRIMQGLGYISISLYLTHFMVMTSFSAWVYLQCLHHGMSIEQSCNITLALSIPVVLGVACIFAPVERAIQRFCRDLTFRLFPAYQRSHA